MSLCRWTFRLNPFIKALPRNSQAPSLTYRNIARGVSAVAAKAKEKVYDISISECLSKIEVEIKTSGRISQTELNLLLQGLSHKVTPTTVQVPLILRCCGTVAAIEKPETRMKYLEKIWDKVHSLDLPLNVSHYNTVLKIHLENEWPFSPEEFLREMKKNGIEPNRVTYQHILSQYCYNGDLNQATKVLEEMKTNQYPLNENVFASLIMGHCVAKDFKGAESILQLMKEKQLDMSAHTYAMYLCGLGIAGDVDRIKQVLEVCKEEGIVIRSKHMLDIVYHMAVNGHREDAAEILSMINDFQRHELILLMYRILHKKAYEVFFDVFEKTFTSVEPRRIRFAFRCLAINGSIDDIMKFSDECKRRGYALDPVLQILYYMHMNQMKKLLTKPLELLKMMKEQGYEIREHYFWPILAQATEEADEHQISVILNSMREFDVPCSNHALKKIVFYNLEGTKEDFYKILQSCHFLGGNRDNAVIMHVLGRLTKGNTKYALNICKLVLELCPCAGEEVTAMSHSQNFILPYQYHNTNILGNQLVHQNENMQDIVDIMYIWATQRKLLREQQPWRQDIKDEEGDPIQMDKEFVSDIVKKAIEANAQPDFVKDLLKALTEKGLAITKETGELISEKWRSEEISALVDKAVNCELDEMHKCILSSKVLKRLMVSLSDVQRQFKECCRLRKFDEALKLLLEDPSLDSHEWYIYLIMSLRNSEEKATLRSCLELYLDKFKAELNLTVMMALIEMEMYEQVVSYIGVSLSKTTNLTTQRRMNLNMFFQELLKKDHADALKKMLSLSNLWIVNRGNLKRVVEAYNSRNELEKAIEIVKGLPKEAYGRLNGHKVFLPIMLDRRNDTAFFDKMMELFENVGMRSKAMGYLFVYACKGDIKGGRQALNSLVIREKIPLQLIADVVQKAKDATLIIENMLKILKGDDRFLKIRMYEKLIRLYQISGEPPQKGLELYEDMQEEGVPPTGLFMKYLSSYMKEYEMTSPLTQGKKSNDFMASIIPERYLPEAIQHYASKNYHGLQRVLKKAISENNIAPQDIADLILAAESENEDESLLKMYSTCLDIANIWNSWNKGELLSYINMNLQEDGNNDGDRLAVNVLKAIPAIRLVSCMCRGEPSVSFTTESARIVLWTQCKTDPRYGDLADLLYAHIQQSLKENVSAIKTVLSHTKLMPVPYAQKTLSTLLEDPSFLSNPMRFEAEKMFNHLDSRSKVEVEGDDGVESPRISPLEADGASYESEKMKKASETVPTI